MAFVEHDGIAQRDGTRVVGVGIEQVEQPARSLAVALIPVDQTLAIDRTGGSGGGQGFPFQRLVLDVRRRGGVSRVHEPRRRLSSRPGSGVNRLVVRLTGAPRLDGQFCRLPPARRKKASPTGVGLAFGDCGRIWRMLGLLGRAGGRDHPHAAHVQRRRPRAGAGRAAGSGGAVALPALSHRAADFDRMADVVAELGAGIAHELQRGSGDGRGCRRHRPEVPTALSSPHFRSDRRNDGRFPSLQTPRYRDGLPGILGLPASVAGSGGGGWLWGGVAWAERPTANAAATKVPAIAASLDILLGLLPSHSVPTPTVVFGPFDSSMCAFASTAFRSRGSPVRCESQATVET